MTEVQVHLPLLLPEHSERPFSTLETRSRISSFQSHASRRDREFLPFSLMLRDKIENFFLLISCFEMRTRISFINLRHRDENENRDWDNSRENFRELHLLLVYWQIFSKKRLLFSQNFLKSYVFFSREIWIKISFFETRTGIFFQHLVSRDENGNFFILISCFEKETRIWKSFLKVEREKMNLILTRIPEIENSRYALKQNWSYPGNTSVDHREEWVSVRVGHALIFADAHHMPTDAHQPH